jgi:glycosyltransferase involved in cell wall biosynthesis
LASSAARPATLPVGEPGAGTAGDLDFSIVVTTYERAESVMRAVRSCLAQSGPEFEVVVVDDASRDDTVARLEGVDDPRLRVVVHESNRGINPARHTGAAHARGRWLVVLDSDWELLPGALARLRDVIATLPPDVAVVRFRLGWDDGTVTPRSVPPSPYDYEGRIQWAEEEGGYDAGRCLRRDALARTPYIADRRGAMETLFELDLASRERQVCIDEVLGLEHVDAPGSYLRSAGRDVGPRLVREAPDMLWMAETTLSRHGEALRRDGPRQYGNMLRVASVQAFLLGERRKGARYAIRALRCRPLEPMAWITLGLGLIGPRAVARGTLAFRRFAAWRS